MREKDWYRSRADGCKQCGADWLQQVPRPDEDRATFWCRACGSVKLMDVDGSESWNVPENFTETLITTAHTFVHGNNDGAVGEMIVYCSKCGVVVWDNGVPHGGHLQGQVGEGCKFPSLMSNAKGDD